MGYMLNEMFDRMNEANKTGLPLYALYSTHDDVLNVILGGFGLPAAYLWPPYASHIIFELWRSVMSGDLFVRIVYNGELQVVPGCTLSKGTLCSWTEFGNIIKANFTITDYEKQCL